MDLVELIKSFLKEGKTKEEAIEEAFNQGDEGLEAKAVATAYEKASKAIEAETLLSEKANVEAEEKKIDEKAKKIAEESLKSIKIDGIIEKAISSGKVQVKETGHQWKRDVAQFIRAKVGLAQKDGNFSTHLKTLETLSEKAKKAYEEKGLDYKATSIRTDSDVDGGFLIRPEFDMEMDKLVFRDSELLNAIKERKGGDKTLIDSMSTFDFTYRTNQDAAFTETKPTFNQQEIQYREAGAIVPLARAALEGSDFNLTQELMENAADAKIRLLEFQLTSGETGGGDPFDGIRFHTGVTVYDIIDDANAAGAGKLDSKDLTNAYLAAPAQSRRQGSFILDTRELCLLLEERDDQNLPIETIVNVNGRWIHKKTGLPIIVSDLMSRINTGVATNTGGLDINILFGALNRFRLYQNGGLRVDQSSEVFFSFDQIGIRFILRNKWGIPLNSRSSFVAFNGARNTTIT